MKRPRVLCPDCGFKVAVRADGSFWEHKRTAGGLWRMSPCPGSGKNAGIGTKVKASL